MDVIAPNSPAKNAHPWRYLVAVVVAVVGTLVSAVAFVAVSNSEHRLAAVKLQELAKNDQQTLNSDLEYATEVLYTLRAFYSTADQTVSRSEFQAFAKDLRGRLVGMRNTGWARRVTREERDAFERSVRAEGFPNFEIWERDPQGNRIRARDRAEYFPILYPDPVEYTAQILGFDISSERIRADALRRARSSERPAATPPMNLITKAEPDGFMSFIPVYPKGSIKQETSRTPEGFMYGVFGTGPMIENILGTKAIPSGLEIYFFNPNGDPGNRRIYWHPSRSRPAQSPVPSEDTLLAGAHWTGSIRVADQEWGAIFVPSGQLIADAGSWRPGAALATGLAMTALIVAYLLVSLKRTLRLEFLTTSLHEATDELRREGEKVTLLARTDSLTGLANRAAFADHLSRVFAAAKRDGLPFAVIYLDLDHFKDVNDTLGHPYGDRLLQIAAERLKTVVGKIDLIARLGGDEFAICVTDAADLSSITQLAARIKGALAQKYDLDGSEAHVSASLGISVFDMTAASPEDMMMRADVALYQVKNEGRNNFRFHSTELDHELRERVTVTEDLQAAFTNNELELYYQPQVEVSSGRIVGLEALVRWNHPKRGLMLPASFIPIAEKSGAIHALGRWVLEETCRQIRRWQAEGTTPPTISINISAAQCKSAVTLDQELRETLARYVVDPRCIEVELTEAALTETTAANNDIIRRVRGLGVSVAIDDFGTGYSSLEHLRSYRVNRLKIAQQFMPKVAIEPGAAAIVRATLMLARELGMETIAEGVETAEQVAFLLSAGCRFAQGHYFSAPVPATEAGALLRHGAITREHAPSSADNLRRVAG
ncbi:MAG: EAL domain-containing protein [Xanthobacteraceae bacterium]